MEKPRYLSCRDFKFNKKERPRGVIRPVLNHHTTSRGGEQKAGIENSRLMDPTNLVGSSSGGRDSLRNLLPFVCMLTVVRKLP